MGKNFKFALVKEKTIVHGGRIDPIRKGLSTFDQEIITIVVEKLNLRKMTKGELILSNLSAS